MREVLVLDAAQRSALAVIRSLGRRGIAVHAADSGPKSLAAASRYARSVLQYPDAQRSPAAFIDWVADTARARDLGTIFPTTDLTTMLLAPAQPAAGDLRVACAPQQIYEAVTDKARLVALAASVGVRAPRTVSGTGLAQLEELISRERFPLVLKPARSRALIDGRVLNTSVKIARSREEALAYLRQQPWVETLPCLVQEFIEGYGAGVFTLYHDGEPIAWFAHRRIREKPPSGGVSVLCESVAIDPALRDSSQRLLSAVRWQGAAMIEFRIGRDGTAYLMEVNGRLWGSVQLAIDCGVDFPWLAYQSACGQKPAAVQEYTLGRRLRWFMGDVDNLLLELRGKGLAHTGLQRVQALARFIGASLDLSARNEVFRWSDPAPAWLELGQWFSGLR